MLKPAGLEKELRERLFCIFETSGVNLAEIAELLAAGARLLTDSVWVFGGVEKAFARLDSGHATGKVVFRIGEEA
jgi:hypothetical protein